MEKDKYLIVLDYGKPFNKEVFGYEELKKALQESHEISKQDLSYFDLTIYNDKGEDISESQFINELIAEIIEQDEVFNNE